MLDIEDRDALVAYLRTRGVEDAPDVEILHGGVSNRVVLLRWPSGVRWVMKQALAKLRVPVDWFSSPERIDREALALLELAALGIAVPKLVFHDPEVHVLAMEAVAEPHRNWKTMLLDGDVRMAHVHEFAGMLAKMHSRSSRGADRLAALFSDVRFFESLRIEPYYVYTARQVPEAAAFIHRVIAATRANRVCLVHGDFSPKNILVREDRLILLDHEVCHWGDPAFDLGFALTHLLSKANHLARFRPTFQQAATEFWSVYWDAVRQQEWAEPLQQRAVASALACLLARVDGRSRLEYLAPVELARQRLTVLALLEEVPVAVPTLVDEFVKGLARFEGSTV